MGEISPELRARFEGVTMLCLCWKLETRDGSMCVRATDHDQQISWQGEAYQPGLMLSASSLRQTLSLSPEPLDIQGVLDAEGIREEDLRSGVWDGAKVTIWRVDWQDSAYGLWIWSGFLTGIEESGSVFSVRLASLKSALERTIGRVYGRRCDADFGDTRCGVDAPNASQAACDKRYATCRDVFDNTSNFRGFPHMPGNDSVISGPGEKRDGSSRGIER